MSISYSRSNLHWYKCYCRIRVCQSIVKMTCGCNNSPKDRKRILVYFDRAALLVCILLLMGDVIFCISRYLDNSTTLNIDIKNINEVEFPEFTVCPDFRHGFKTDKLGSHNLTLSDILQGNYGNLTWETFLEVTFEPEELIESFRVTSILDGKKHYFDQDSNPNLYHSSIRTTLERRYGRCATLKIPKSYTDMGLEAIFINSKADMNVFVHHKNQYYANINPKIYTEMDWPLFIDLNFELLNHIPRGNRNCSAELNGQYDDCFMIEALEGMMVMEGCVFPLYWPGSDSVLQYPICQGEHPGLFDKFVTSQIVENCQLPCETTTVSFGFPFKRKSLEGFDYESGKAYVMFKLSRSVNVKTMVLSYPPMSMIAEIGGYSGLLLGISALDLCRLLFRYF